MQKLIHAKIPRIHQIVDIPEYEYIFILMDWVEGTSLKEVISKVNVPNDVVIEWVLQICSVLNYLHNSNILYRNIKPGNIIIDCDNDVNLIDFSLSVEITEDNRVIKSPLGTRGYAAPELYYRGAAYDLRSDIYALGATLFYMLRGLSPDSAYIDTGRRLKLTDFNTSAKKELDAIIKKATEENPNDRYQSIGEMAVDLKAVSNNEKLKDAKVPKNSKLILPKFPFKINFH